MEILNFHKLSYNGFLFYKNNTAINSCFEKGSIFEDL